MKPDQSMDYVLSCCKTLGLTDVEWVLTGREVLSVQVLQGKVEKVNQSNTLQLGVRVLRDNRVGIASTERIEAETIRRMIENAADNALLQDKSSIEIPTAPAEVPSGDLLQCHSAELDQVNLDALTQFAMEAEAAAKARSKWVSAVNHMGVSRSSGWSQRASTKGMHYSQHENHVQAYCSALLQQNDKRKSGGALWNAREWDATQAAQLGQQAVDRAVHLLDASPLSSTRMPIVLDPYTAPDLLGIYLSCFSAEAVQKGLSRLKDQLGKPIAAPHISLKDNPHLPKGMASRWIDAEGTLTQPLTLIDDGVLTHLLYHVESAAKDNTASTGHAARSPSSSVSTTTHNVIMPLGKENTEVLCAKMPRCLLVTELEGGSGCDPVSGDISIGVQGFLYEQGRCIQPVEAVTIAGNFYQLLKDIQATGNSYHPNLDSVRIPALLIDSMDISG